MPASSALSPEVAPPGFVEVHLERSWKSRHRRPVVYDWLCDPRTFVDGQVWPYRVEFAADENGPGDFRPGVFNSHTGPFLNFSGRIGAMEEGRYRDLPYCHGSFAGSFKLIRPTRLQFWLEDLPREKTLVKVGITAFVRTSMQRPWSVAISGFGRFSALTSDRSIDARLRRLA